MNLSQTTSKPYLRTQKEYYIIGTILTGHYFHDIITDGLSCEIQVIYNEKWKQINNQPPIQTQTAYRNIYTNKFAWNQNFEFFFAVNDNSYDTPICILRIWKLDINNKLNVIGYSKFRFPNAAASLLKEIPIWKPLSGYESLQDEYFMNRMPQLSNLNFVLNNSDDLQLMNSAPVGMIKFEFCLIKRFYNEE